MCKNGVLPTEGDWNEQGVMKSIFAQYIYKLNPNIAVDQKTQHWQAKSNS
jgi:hypothetical protein